MAANSVKAPNNHVLIAAGVALLFLAAFGVWTALVSNPNSIPIASRGVIGGAVDALLGAALLFVVFHKSQFAGTTAVIVATFLAFTVASGLVADVLLGSLDVSLRTGINLLIAATILWPMLFPWSWSANRPVLFRMAATCGAITLLLGTVVMLARL